MDISQILLYGLTVWRISSLLVAEDGPFLIFRRLRTWVGIQHDAEGLVFLIPDGFLPKLFSCVWCMSMWVSVAFLILRQFNSLISYYLALWMALSAVAILVEKWLRK